MTINLFSFNLGFLDIWKFEKNSAHMSVLGLQKVLLDFHNFSKS